MRSMLANIVLDQLFASSSIESFCKTTPQMFLNKYTITTSNLDYYWWCVILLKRIFKFSLLYFITSFVIKRYKTDT